MLNIGKNIKNVIVALFILAAIFVLSGYFFRDDLYKLFGKENEKLKKEQKELIEQQKENIRKLDSLSNRIIEIEKERLKSYTKVNVKENNIEQKIKDYEKSVNSNVHIDSIYLYITKYKFNLNSRTSN